MTDRSWPVLVQLNAVSLVDEGPAQVFDVIQEKVAPTGILLLAAHGFNPEVVDRGRIWPGHGPQGFNSNRGGYYATVHDEYYRTSGSDRRASRNRNSMVSTPWRWPARGRRPQSRPACLYSKAPAPAASAMSPDGPPYSRSMSMDDAESFHASIIRNIVPGNSRCSRIFIHPTSLRDCFGVWSVGPLHQGYRERNPRLLLRSLPRDRNQCGA